MDKYNTVFSILKIREKTGLVERREEQNVTCPKCARVVPATLYCIYCGNRLPRRPAPPPAPPKPVAIPPPPPKPVRVKEDIRELLTNISLQYTRKIALLGLLRSKEVSEGIFMKLYQEYTDKLQGFLSARTRMMERLRSELDEKEKSRGKLKTFLEEIDVRRKIGEIPLQEFTKRSERLRSQIGELEETLSRIRKDLNYLQKLFIDKALREVLDLESKTKTCYGDLERLVAGGAVTRETMERIKPDIEGILKLLDSLTKGRKERQKTLQEELETLETRYRVGEVSVEHYEKRKHELQSELQKLWG